MIKLDQIIGKTYAAKGTFTEVNIANQVPQNAITFTASNNRLQYNIEGILINFSQNPSTPKYRAQLTKITSRDHTIDLTEIKHKLRKPKNIEEEFDETYTADTKSERISGIYKRGIPLIQTAYLIEEEDNKVIETEFDIASMNDALTIGFQNLLYERIKGKINIIKPNAETISSKTKYASVVVGIKDGEFITEEFQDGHDESLVKRSYITLKNYKEPHVRAGHRRHYIQENGSVMIIAVAPYVVGANNITEEQKKQYYLGPRCEITQETMDDKVKGGSLEPDDIALLIKVHNIPTYEEIYNI